MVVLLGVLVRCNRQSVQMEDCRHEWFAYVASYQMSRHEHTSSKQKILIMFVLSRGKTFPIQSQSR